MKTYKKRIILSVIIIAIIIVFISTICHTIVKKSVSDKMYNNLAEIPYNKVGLLLGTAPITPQGEHNYYFDYRIDAATELYKAGKVSYILVSGDNHSEDYDEAGWMKEALIKQGVPDSAIVLDYAGFRTFDSVVRAKEIFGHNNLTIISQQFHSERAVYLAEHFGISAIAYNAKDVNILRKKIKMSTREPLARVKLYLDLITNKQPKYLGDKIQID
jgi:Uncharacterized membrane protein